MKYLDRIANIAVIVAVIVFLIVVGRQQFGRHLAPRTSAQDFVGKTVTLPGVQFVQGRNTLVLVLSTTCHFCKESLPFYKELATKANGQIDMLAVLPEPQAEAEKYLKDAAVPMTQIISAALNSVGVYATPTLLLVDSRGKVQGAWVGRLDEKGQQQLLSRALPAT